MRYNFFTIMFFVIVSVCSFGQQAFAGEKQHIISLFNLLLAGPEKVTQLIEARDGGILTLSNGISVTIPANALSEDTEISLTEVDVIEFDGLITTLGGVNGLHLAIIIFEPDGTILNEPAIVHFPLPEDWEIDTELVWSTANGNDPFDVLPTTDKVTVTGSPGSYVAEVNISHFSSGAVSRNCHSGTFRTVVNEFVEAGCTQSKIIEAITDKHPKYEIDSEEAKFVGPSHIQAFLDTYFDEYKGGRPNSFYNKGEIVSEATLDSLKTAVRSGRQVAIAFNTSENWPKKTVSNEFYKPFGHTATLVKNLNGSVDVHHVIVHSAYSKGKLNKLIKSMGETLYYRTSLDENSFQDFRDSKNGLAFKDFVQSKIGKMVDGVWVPDYDDEFFTVSKKNNYNSVNIYIDKRTDASANPCAEEVGIVEDTCSSRGLPGPEVVTWDGREWQRCTNTTESYSMAEAKEYCNNLILGGYSDWRLPTKDELKGLVVCEFYSGGFATVPLADYTNCGVGTSYKTPTIDPGFYSWPRMYWSATMDEENAWYVYFLTGRSSTMPTSGWGMHARCVR